MTGVRDLGLPQGNPLALPRREAAAAGAVSSGKYDLVQVGTATRPSPTGSTVSHIILMNGRGCFFRQQSTTIYRTTFDYSSAGITNLTTVSGTSSTLPFTLPGVGGVLGTLTLQGRYLWSHPVSPTETLFHYADSSNPGSGLFLATWDGTGSPTITAPTLPSGFVKNRGSGKWGSDAFILEDGNLGILASNSTTGQIALHIYTPTFTFVRTLNIVNLGATVAAAAAVKIRKTSYGYIVAIYVSASTSLTGAVATLNKDCTSVISTINAALTGTITGYSAGAVLGEDGAIITGLTSTTGVYGAVSSLVFPVSSSGIVTNSANSATNSNNPYLDTGTTSQQSLIDAIFQGSCCSKYADRNSPYAFLVSSSSTGTWGGGYSYSPNASGPRSEYSDMVVTPFINLYGDPASSTRRTAQIETDVKSVQSISDTSGYTADVSAEDPERGFVLLSSNEAGYTMRLFEKVYR